MPVKIFTDPVITNNVNGVINETDLQQMINHYQTDALVNSVSGQPPNDYFRFFSAFIRTDELLSLISNAPAEGGINLHFSITKPSQKDCDGTTDIGDMLTFVLCAAGNDKTDMMSAGNLVLIPGFKAYSSSMDTLAPEAINILPPSGSTNCCISPGGGKVR